MPSPNLPWPHPIRWMIYLRWRTSMISHIFWRQIERWDYFLHDSIGDNRSHPLSYENILNNCREWYIACLSCTPSLGTAPASLRRCNMLICQTEVPSFPVRSRGESFTLPGNKGRPCSSGCAWTSVSLDHPWQICQLKAGTRSWTLPLFSWTGIRHTSASFYIAWCACSSTPLKEGGLESQRRSNSWNSLYSRQWCVLLCLILEC